MTDEIPNEVKKAIIQQEIGLYKNTAYQAQLRYRVNKKLGAEESVLKALEAEMTKCEATIDILNQELDALDK